MTDHQLTLAGFLLSLTGAVVPLCLWFKRKLDLISKKSARRKLEAIAKIGIQRYAEKRLQRMRLCVGAYFFSAGYMVPRVAVQWLNNLYPFAAAICFAVAIGYSQTTTVHGVTEFIRSYRKRLNLPEDPPPEKNAAPRTISGSG